MTSPQQPTSALLVPGFETERPWQVAVELGREDLTHPSLTALQVQLLHNRGVSTSAAEAWMAADWRRGAEEVLPGLAAACARIHTALAEGQRIVVFGDHDSDGMTSCALLTLALRALGGDAHPYVPRREDDGRGLNPDAVRTLAAEGARLIITTDCGTTNVAETELASSLGVDVVVTDHHAPYPPLAPAVALVNPWLASERTPACDLAGVGVAFRVAEALLAGTPQAPLLPELLDLVALGTLGDAVPLTWPNWALVHAGMQHLRTAARPGLRALLARARLTAADVTERDISFGLVPRLNAGARMGEPEVTVRLLLAADAAEAQALADRLDRLNTERQQATEGVLAVARVQALEQLALGQSLLVAEGDHWPLGILGPVAGRLVEELGRPVLVLSHDGSECRASGRGPEGVSLVDVLAQRQELFRRYGGHARAAGFTLATADVPAAIAYLRDAVAQYATAAEHDTPAAPLAVDCRLPLALLTPDRFAALRALAPFGTGFAEPVFVATHVRILRCWRTGAEGRNLRVSLREGKTQRLTFWPRQGGICEALQRAIPTLPLVDVAYALDGLPDAEGIRQPRARLLGVRFSAGG